MSSPIVPKGGFIGTPVLLGCFRELAESRKTPVFSRIIETMLCSLVWVSQNRQVMK